MSLTAALSWIDSRQAEMEALLRELVEISSHTADPAGCTLVAVRLKEALASLAPSLKLALLPSSSGKYGQHLVGRTAAEGAHTILIGHHDTVFPKATFSGFREDGALLRGPGVLDMKGGLVVIAFALGALEAAGLLATIPLRVVSVSDEEVGSPDGSAIIEAQAPGARAALVFESGRQNDLIVTRRKGTGAMTARAYGKSAHAGNSHHEGKNAIWALARFIDRAQGLTDYERGRTVNVGKIAGGIGKNTVPSEAEALLDFRFVDGADGKALERALAEAAAAAAESVPGTRIELSGGIARPPLERTPASAELAARYGACARESGLGGEEAALIGGGSDANNIAALGVPAIDGLGPRGRGFHTVEEHIERATLVPKAAALVRMLARDFSR
jgi:glutamate carboxypeptidase